jgi:hypothetical protein
VTVMDVRIEDRQLCRGDVRGKQRQRENAS